MKNPLQLVINWFRLETQLAKVGRNYKRKYT